MENLNTPSCSVWQKSKHSCNIWITSDWCHFPLSLCVTFPCQILQYLISVPRFEQLQCVRRGEALALLVLDDTSHRHASHLYVVLYVTLHNFAINFQSEENAPNALLFFLKSKYHLTSHSAYMSTLRRTRLRCGEHGDLTGCTYLAHFLT